VPARRQRLAYALGGRAPELGPVHDAGGEVAAVDGRHRGVVDDEERDERREGQAGERGGPVDELDGDEALHPRPAKPLWPTLRDLIDRDERVIVLTENQPGAVPWIHRQPAVMQETPYRFRSAAELAAEGSCAPNRGGTEGSLFLVNHWVDTSPAPRPGIAREVNARAFLDDRLTRCRRERGLLPTVVAVDFYREGDVFGAVAELNEAR
jgi:hypothetical protein